MIGYLFIPKKEILTNLWSYIVWKEFINFLLYFLNEDGICWNIFCFKILKYAKNEFTSNIDKEKNI